MNPNVRIIFIGILFGTVVMSGCATAHALIVGSPYRPDNALTGGYSETRLAPDMVRVVFRGNSSTSEARAKDLALLRSADLSLQAGFPFFRVEKEETDVEKNTSDDLTISMPRSEILVQFLMDKPPGYLVFDAEFLVHTLKNKYKLE